MRKQHAHISVKDTDCGFKYLVENWHRAKTSGIEQAKKHPNFEAFPMLASSILTPKYLELMKMLRKS